VAAAELLAAKGARVTVSEARSSVPERERLESLGIRVASGGNDPALFTNADLIVLSPGVPVESSFLDEARRSGVSIIGELELASRWLRGRVIAITGTKGKSTTTTLTGLMLDAAGFRTRVAGNIGTPLSAHVNDSTADTLHVVEASSFQLETIERFHPWIAAVLNLSPDHLDRHPTEAAYAGAKARIFENQTRDDWAVVNADDEGARALGARSIARRRWYGFADVTEGVTVAGDSIVERSTDGDVRLVETSTVRVSGRHILSDVLAAAAISRLAGASSSAIADAVRGFTGLEHAMELAGEVGGVRFINDSKATNIASARRSIEAVDRGLVVILGGRFKGGDFHDLREPLRGRADGVVAIGEARPLIVDALGDLLPVREATSMADAVQTAWTLARPAGTVVLAPACSSFDMFADYAERGRRFKEEVARLAVSGPVSGEP
jgi:UDP-N-acetylmuramoylalanine--D-glutamate ligase